MENKSIQTVIVEDEKPAARRLKRMLEKAGFADIVLLHSVAESVQYFQKHPKPELLFLDVQLGDGLSFDIFKQLPNLESVMVIFTTAYDQYALQAFDLKSVDYLLKPIVQQKLEKALTKFEALYKNKTSLSSSALQHLKEAITGSETSYQNRFSLKVGTHFKIFRPEDIECFSSQQKATYLNTQDGKRYLMDKSLTELSPRLPPRQFFRINRQLIVNIDFIKDIAQYSNSRLKITLPHFNQTKSLIVSRERVKKFRAWLDGA